MDDTMDMVDRHEPHAIRRLLVRSALLGLMTPVGLPLSEGVFWSVKAILVVSALALGLTAIRNDYAFVCACDSPFLRADLASSLCAMLEHHDAVVPVIAGLVQPLHAVYRKRCIAAINSMIAAGEARLAQIVEAVSVRKVGEQELRAIDPQLLSFINVNTPEDYERALRLVSETD